MKTITAFKFDVLCFDNKVNQEFEGKIMIGVFAESESEAVKQAKKRVKRKFYEVTDGNEFFITKDVLTE